MSGYGGNPDMEAEHANILAENGIHASRLMLEGEVRTHCLTCGKPIVEARRAYALRADIKCEHCVVCQEDHDAPRRIKMLDHVL